MSGGEDDISAGMSWSVPSASKMTTPSERIPQYVGAGVHGDGVAASVWSRSPIEASADRSKHGNGERTNERVGDLLTQGD